MIPAKTLLLPLFLGLASLPALAAQKPTNVCDPRTYGAKADGMSLDTAV